MKFLASSMRIALLTMIATVFWGFGTSKTWEIYPINPQPGYYLVVAAYLEDGSGFAERFSQKFKEQGFENANFQYFPEKKFNFVYLNYYTSREESLEAMRKVRREGVCSDAWVFVYRPEEINPIPQKEPTPTPTPEPEPEPEAERESETEPIEETEVEPAENEVEVETENEPEEEVITEVEDAKEGNYKLFLNLYNGQNNKRHSGEIEIHDPTQGRLVNKVPANQTVQIFKPSNAHSEAQFEANIFGFRKVIHTIDLESPHSDTTDFFVTTQGDSIIMDFELFRFGIGDKFTMFHVYFYSHSAIMRQESLSELNELVEMLNENPDLRLRIHGHTNGSAAGDTDLKAKDDTSFFSRNGSFIKHTSAKELSEERATRVMLYLLNEGIDESRVEVRGWGGRRMLYNKSDPEAIKNVRVEIELLK